MRDEQPWEAKFMAERSRALAEEARADAAEAKLAEVEAQLAADALVIGNHVEINHRQLLQIQAAEAQRDRLAVVVEGTMRALGAAHIVACDEPEWPTPCTPENCQITAAVEAARAALADVRGQEGGHSAPAAESTADTDTLPDSTNEARQARKRDEAYRAMRDALVLVAQDGRHNSTMVWDAIDNALALARQVKEE